MWSKSERTFERKVKTQHWLTYRYLSWTTGHLIRLEGRTFHLVIQGWTLSIIMPRKIISFKTFLKSDDYFHARLRCIFTVLVRFVPIWCRLGLKKCVMKIQRYFRQNFTPFLFVSVHSRAIFIFRAKKKQTVFTVSVFYVLCEKWVIAHAGKHFPYQSRLRG